MDPNKKKKYILKLNIKNTNIVQILKKREKV